ncbi:MAG: carboxylating nicotinate-nucleotide diphosphorylase [Firmicutes bacterium]|nr:carboxylating nicotinate-nucleotide diphosphorylase [Bacillota bacterium]
MLIDKILRQALEEDLGRGDITTEAITPSSLPVTADLISKSSGILAGVEIAQRVFHLIDPDIRFQPFFDDGGQIEQGQVIASIAGNARSILAGERVALNFLQRLSGIATATHTAVEAAEPFGTTITDTRKTTPGLRVLEKYAVRMGGGKNHRFGLDDAVLIKDNHIEVAGGITTAIDLARAHVGHMVKVEVEVETLSQVKEALAAGADVIMLDNMEPQAMKEAVAVIADQAIVEASGGITPAQVATVAAAGVDVVSLGWLTHSAPPLDISLDIKMD